MNANEFFENMTSLQSDKKIDTALRKMFKEVEEEIVKDVNDLSTTDSIFEDERSKSFDKDLQVGLLVITLPWKSKLKNRKKYVEFVKSTLLNHLTEKQTDRVLSGLI